MAMIMTRNAEEKQPIAHVGRLTLGWRKIRSRQRDMRRGPWLNEDVPPKSSYLTGILVVTLGVTSEY